METKLQNGLNGKTLVTIVKLPEIPNVIDMGRTGTAQMRIYTTKNSRGIVQSHVGVEFDMTDGCTLSRYPDDFGYFHQPKTLIKRATEKALQTIHAETLADFDAIKARALAHYNVAGV